MKYLSYLILLLLTACSTVPVTSKFPEAPQALVTAKCPDLKKLPENPQLSTVAKTVTENYTLYHECSIKVDAWKDWYSEQKKIYEGVK